MAVFNKFKQIEKKYLMYETTNMSPNLKIKWKKANSYFIYNHKNQKIIDFTSGIFASCLGYRNKNLK